MSAVHSFLLELPYLAEAENIADELEFLDGGSRGFIFSVDRVTEAVTVRPGDGVYLV